MIDQRNYNIVK